jgi:hypothetical protein
MNYYDYNPYDELDADQIEYIESLEYDEAEMRSDIQKEDNQ